MGTEQRASLGHADAVADEAPAHGVRVMLGVEIEVGGRDSNLFFSSAHPNFLLCLHKVGNLDIIDTSNIDTQTWLHYP
jgi:hypothetical protein